MSPVGQNTTGVNQMVLYLVHTMNKLKVDNLTFFRMAHVWCFGTDPPLHDDVAQFLLHSVVPKYVERYLAHLREQTT
jgi:hypothetical protein